MGLNYDRNGRDQSQSRNPNSTGYGNAVSNLTARNRPSQAKVNPYPVQKAAKPEEEQLTTVQMKENEAVSTGADSSGETNATSGQSLHNGVSNSAQSNIVATDSNASSEKESGEIGEEALNGKGIEGADKSTTSTTKEEISEADKIEVYFKNYEEFAQQQLDHWYAKTTLKEEEKLTGAMFAKAARKVYDAKKDLKYVVPVEYALSQALLEGGVKGKERTKGNIFNVGAFDSGKTETEKGLNSKEKGFDAYYKLMGDSFLNGKSADELLKNGNFTNKNGGVYASNPFYEIEIKAEIGGMHLRNSPYSLSAFVGKGQKNLPADVAFIGNMLATLGYISQDKVNDGNAVSNAVLEFQKKELAPENEEWFKNRMKMVTNSKDQDSMKEKTKNFTDGIVGKAGVTIGLLYFNTYLNGKIPSVTNNLSNKDAETEKYGDEQVNSKLPDFLEKDVNAVETVAEEVNEGKKATNVVDEGIEISEEKAVVTNDIVRDPAQYYTVQNGDYPAVLSKLFNISIDELKSLNSDKWKVWKKSEGFNEGDKIYVPTVSVDMLAAIEKQRKQAALEKKIAADKVVKECKEAEDKAKEAEKKETKVTAGEAQKTTSGTSNNKIEVHNSSYSKRLWTPDKFEAESKVEINESKLSKEEKEFFSRYKKVADAYLNEWYAEKKTPVEKRLTGTMFVNAAKRIFQKYGSLGYIVPIELALIQGRLESELGTKGASHFTNPYNVGETDKGAKEWVKKISNPEMGIFVYMDLMAHDYLSTKSADQLLETQGKSFVNEKGSRYASAPRYEMELKAMMGQTSLVADGKRTKNRVGKGYEKNDGTEDAIFVRGMLKKLGYSHDKLSNSVTAFQSHEMYPPLTTYQQELVKGMNAGDLKSHNEKEKKGVDGSVYPKGNTLGLLYYMAKGSGFVKHQPEKKDAVESAKGKKATVKEEITGMYNQYLDHDNMITFGVSLKPYCFSKSSSKEILAIFNKLGSNDGDNLAYVLSNKSSNEELAKFDRDILNEMLSALDPKNNFFSKDKKQEQWERIDKIVNKPTGTTKEEKEANKSKEELTKEPSLAAPKLVSSVVSYEEIPEEFKNEFTIGAGVGRDLANKADDVKKIQNLLVRVGYNIQIDGKISTAGKTNGLVTLNAIFHFQEQSGLTGDCKIGPKGNTIKKLLEKAYSLKAYAEKNKTSEIHTLRKGKISDLPASLIAKGVTGGHLIGIDNSGYLLPTEFHANGKKLREALLTIRKELGAFEISCAYRSPEHNVMVAESTATQSQHLYGIAADIQTPAGYTPKSLRKEILKLIEEKKIPEGGVGLYGWGVHYDIRGTATRWG